MQDGDLDGDNNSDENEIRRFGHAADESDRSAISRLIERYRAMAATGQGTQACLLLNASLAAGLAQEGGEPSSSPHKLQGACGNIAVRLFGQAAGRSDIDVTIVDLRSVRVDGPNGLAIIRLATGEERDMPVIRERGAWKIGALFDLGMV
jgi:hypothetical protein